MTDLFKDIKHGKHFTKKGLKKEASHELDELGGLKRAEAYEKKVKASKKEALLKKKRGSRD